MSSVTARVEGKARTQACAQHLVSWPMLSDLALKTTAVEVRHNAKETADPIPLRIRSIEPANSMPAGTSATSALRNMIHGIPRTSFAVALRGFGEPTAQLVESVMVPFEESYRNVARCSSRTS